MVSTPLDNAIAETSLHLWSVDDYHRMIKAEILTEEDKVELLEGKIIEMSAHLPPHAATLQRTFKCFNPLLANRADIRTQLPVTLPPNSEPEPDIAVVRIDPREYIDGHPTTSDIYLLIEVADRTFKKDTNQKALAYAKAKIADYWVLDVKTRSCYVFRDPTDNGYHQQIVLGEDALLSPLAFADVEVRVGDLFV